MKWFLLFSGAVIIPSLILGVIAARSLRHEEAFLSSQLENALRVEQDRTAESARSVIDAAASELGKLVELDPAGDYHAVLSGLKARNPLVKVPFLISRNGEILWPRHEAGIAPEESAFLRENSALLAGDVPVQTYRNVALLQDEEKPSVGMALPEKPASRAATDGKLAEKLAMARFLSSSELQQEAYRKAKTSKKQTLLRKVKPLTQDSYAVQDRSLLVAEQLPFPVIAGKSGSGMFPRVVGQRLDLFYWKRLPPSGAVAGCLVDMDVLTKRILGVLPVPYSETRIITVLDQNGAPLLVPTGSGEERDWKRPFLSEEIGEALPHWEVATYLTDPAALASKARARALITGMLIAILIGVILTGGVVIVRSVHHESILAQQKATFAANVSHELKTPLTSIRLFAEMLRRGRPAVIEKQERYLDMMIAESERLSNLINNVLDFSKIERGEKTYARCDTDLADLARQVLENLRPHLEGRGFRIAFRAPDAGAPVHADPEAIRQVIVNLLSNAEKYSDRAREIDVAVAAEGGIASVAVSDRGIGVPPSHAGRIFEKFYRADDRLVAGTRGAGLGLTIARAIARDHGGDVAYLPREGGGSVFTLTLPSAAAARQGRGEKRA